ncbi:MAG: DUF4760 domain-containing protein [Acidobacteriaceae bacterium]
MMTTFHIEGWLPSAAWAGVAAACVSALIALWGFWKQNKSYKESLALELAMKLDEKFNSKKFRKLRSLAAQALLNQGNENQIADCEEIFDFFEPIGLFVKRGSLDAGLVHNFFFHWVNLYWNAGKRYIEQRRTHAGALWTEFERLYLKLVEIEKNEDKFSSDISPSQQQIEEQLREEIQDFS